MDKKQIEALEKEAKQRWGKTTAYKQSQERVKKMTKQDWARINADGEKILQDVVKLLDHDVHDKAVQEVIARHYNHLRNFYEPSLEMYKGLAEMYLADPRFTAYFAKYHKALPQFMHDAMGVYCEK